MTDLIFEKFGCFWFIPAAFIIPSINHQIMHSEPKFKKRFYNFLFLNKIISIKVPFKNLAHYAISTKIKTCQHKLKLQFKILLEFKHIAKCFSKSYKLNSIV